MPRLLHSEYIDSIIIISIIIIIIVIIILLIDFVTNQALRDHETADSEAGEQICGCMLSDVVLGQPRGHGNKRLEILHTWQLELGHEKSQ